MPSCRFPQRLPAPRPVPSCRRRVEASACPKGWNSASRAAIQGRYFDFAAERCGGNADWHFTMQVVMVAFKHAGEASVEAWPNRRAGAGRKGSL